jgi:glycosyltransferase involved in cell wall biosynthesis
MAQPGTGIRYLGYLPEADLPTVMAGASALLYPSYYEGFGFPVLEAMAAGAPVVTSNLSALPEIAGSAALLIDPHSAGAIAGAVRQILLSGRRVGRTHARLRHEACRAIPLERLRPPVDRFLPARFPCQLHPGLGIE